MRALVLLLSLLPLWAQAANIRESQVISCISDESSLLGRHKQFDARKQSEKAKSWFSEWLMGENFGEARSKIRFIWTPSGAPGGPSVRLETSDKAHNLVRLRSNTKNSLIVVTSASNPFSTESWTFAFNFAVETLIATRVQSNLAGVKGEVITYDCYFESLKPVSGDAGSANS